MKNIFRFVWPPTLGSQVIGLVVLAVMFTFAIYAVLSLDLWQERGPPPRVRPQQAALDLALRPLAALRQRDQEREALILSANVLAPDLNLREVTEENAPPRSEWVPLEGGFKTFLDRLHAVGFSATSGQGGVEKEPIFIAELQNGMIIASNLFPPIPPPRRPNLLSSSLVTGEELILLLVILPLILLWAASRISMQLRSFARAAEEFSMEGDHAPLVEMGSAEIRTAVRAFNRMRDRLVEYAMDRTRMLSAIGHDLRTPVTRLRLRAEFIEDGELREGITRDIARMDSMIDSALSFFRDGQAEVKYALFSVRSLLQTICDDFADMGAKIKCVAEADAQITGDAEAIERAVENLLHNSTKHAKTVHLTLDNSDSEFIFIDVDDDGPGIPGELREKYVQPFVRGDDTDDDNRRHFGLGLSITNAIATAHGGTLELSKSKLGGLRARISLPR